LEVAIIMDKLDMNANGDIDYSELNIANISIDKMLHEDKLREAFDLFDKDHDGSITSEELRLVLGPKDANGKLIIGNDDMDEWERVIEEVDLNGDGEIQFNEFTLMMFKLLGMTSLPEIANNTLKKKKEKRKTKLRKKQKNNKEENKESGN
jgi:Ca2+-binding EF-hand superfamily protein